MIYSAPEKAHQTGKGISRGCLAADGLLRAVTGKGTSN